MREKPVILSALIFSGTLAVNVGMAWSQATPGDPSRPGGAQPSQADKSGMWSADDIKKAQQALKEKGHDPGAVDGVMSSKTQQAIRAFQQKNSLQPTGALNAETAAALGVSPSGAGGKSSPGQPGAGGKPSPESGPGPSGSRGSGPSDN
jgi:peptidoglycan hydrolase-like protein with peptidoglycan-binding domain